MRENSATASPSNVTPPPGAELVDDWQPDPWHRVVFGPDLTITDSLARVYISAIQLADGSIDDGTHVETPGMYVCDDENEGFKINSDQARELATALLEAAAAIDAWTRHVAGVDTVVPR